MAIIIQDEAARRDSKKYDLRLRCAGFRGDKTLERFDFGFNPGVDGALIRDLAACRFVEEKVGVLIAGPCGTGKSHVAQAIGHRTVRNGTDVMFTTQLLAQIAAARATGSVKRNIQTMIRVPLLIIDDFGLKPLPQGQDEDLHDHQVEGYERSSTIVQATWTSANGEKHSPTNYSVRQRLTDFVIARTKWFWMEKVMERRVHQLRPQNQTFKSTLKKVNNQLCLKWKKAGFRWCH